MTFFSQYKALCTAENCPLALHNLLTLRGAMVRDAMAWADYLTEAIELYGAIPTSCSPATSGRWGRERCEIISSNQRDIYKYLHDQSVRSTWSTRAMPSASRSRSGRAARRKLAGALVQPWLLRLR